MYRHGDLSFHKIEKLPKGKGKNVKNYILAEGEHTGHKHTLTAVDPQTQIEIIDSIKGLYFEVKNGKALLTHQEHKPIEFDPGIYEVKIEREFDYFTEEIKQVLD